MNVTVWSYTVCLDKETHYSWDWQRHPVNIDAESMQSDDSKMNNTYGANGFILLRNSPYFNATQCGQQVKSRNSNSNYIKLFVFIIQNCHSEISLKYERLLLYCNISSIYQIEAINKSSNKIQMSHYVEIISNDLPICHCHLKRE